MKKSNPPNQPKTDFKNKPFKSLKDLVPAKTAHEKKRSSSGVYTKNQGHDDGDDVALFMQAAEGAKRLGQDADTYDISAAGKCPNKTGILSPNDSQLFLAAMKKFGASFRDTFPERELEDADRRTSTSRMRQLKRGTIRISQELDLHGFLRDESLLRLERFITDACNRGQQAVLVITGKGINSPEGPVLRGAVADWLGKKGKTLVAEFAPAPHALGGSGAFVVFLKKK